MSEPPFDPEAHDAAAEDSATEQDALLVTGDDDFRAGYVAVIGRPNVGKSTLVNAFVGQPLAPVSPVPQTTRRRLLGILSRPDAQIVFVDTPGIHDPAISLGHAMLADADRALADADLVLWVVDCTRTPGEEDTLARQWAAKAEAPCLLVINKLDRCPDGGHTAGFGALAGDMPAATFRTAATTGEGLPELLEAVVAALPFSPPFFPEDQVSDAFEREIATDLIREAAMIRLSEELPHATAVRVEDWQVRPNGLIYIRALVFVERESQKAMVIGRGGQMLKAIGSLARERLEAWLEQRVHLDLHVKVLKNWRKNESSLRRLGLLR